MRRAAATGLLLLGLLAGAACAGGGAPPEGVWQVEEVHVDLKDQPRWRHVPGDPRLRHRVLRIAADGTARFNHGKTQCERPRWEVQHEAAVAPLFARTFRRPPAAGTQAVVPADLGLAGLPAKADRWVATCADGSGAARPWVEAHWFLPLPDGRMLFAYEGDTLLVLKRVQGGDGPRPSFACTAARSATEQAICGSPELAGLDRSVAEAFARALKRSSDAAAVRAAQQKWLRDRNACGAGAECLEQQMDDRVLELMQE